MTVPSTPLTPEQAQALQHAAIPGFVFEEFNRMIAERLSNGVARVPLVALMEAVFARAKALPEFSALETWRELPESWFSWRNVNLTYGAAGWAVEFDRPAYFESGESMFILRARR